MVEFIAGLVAVIIGYVLGRLHNIPNQIIVDQLRGVTKMVSPLRSKTILGAVNRPTAREVYLRDHPEVLEELEQMRDTFKELKVDK